MKSIRTWALFIAAISLATWSQAEEIVGAALEEPTAINETSETSASISTSTAVSIPAQVAVDVSTAPAISAPVVASTSPALSPDSAAIAVSTVPAIAAPAPVVAVPVVVPVAVGGAPDTVISWKTLEGTVQSVDRRNHILTLQDRDGKDVEVAVNNDIEIRRRGQSVAYADVEPNDNIVLRNHSDERRINQ
jgi:hypothetical protein